MALDSLISDSVEQGRRIAGCGLLCSSGRPLPALKDVLASHTLIHAAEGEFYREAIAGACKCARLNVVRVRERDVLRQAAEATNSSETELKEVKWQEP